MRQFFVMLFLGRFWDRRKIRKVILTKIDLSTNTPICSKCPVWEDLVFDFEPFCRLNFNFCPCNERVRKLQKRLFYMKKGKIFHNSVFFCFCCVFKIYILACKVSLHNRSNWNEVSHQFQSTKSLIVYHSLSVYQLHVQFLRASSSMLDTLDAKEDSEVWFIRPLSETNITDLKFCQFKNWILYWHRGCVF